MGIGEKGKSAESCRFLAARKDQIRGDIPQHSQCESEDGVNIACALMVADDRDQTARARAEPLRLLCQPEAWYPGLHSLSGHSACESRRRFIETFTLGLHPRSIFRSFAGGAGSAVRYTSSRA